ncbi:hypothetical protein G7046_g2605 [Stylonectria norvegica]|nr:hypothetical protein G7046_g2605 [Stylonectria norvegica]
MPPKKRSYVPKTKGCYECSQRRIHCDRTGPQCLKCASKGLKCSGLGIRHRFNDGVASRGKWAGKAMETIYNECARAPSTLDIGVVKLTSRDRSKKVSLSTKNITNRFRRETTVTVIDGVESPIVRFCQPDYQFDSGMQIVEDEKQSVALGGVTSDIVPEDWIWHEDACSPGPSTPDHTEIVDLDDEVSNQQLTSDFTGAVVSRSILFQPLPDIIPRWKRHMLLHFSEHIAREMVAIDGLHNGWRNLLLPFAETDELVMNAVLSVSAFHLSQKTSSSSLSNSRIESQSESLPVRQLRDAEPNKFYARTILGLQQRSELSSCDVSVKHSVLMTILVLLTGTMVTGYSDFPTIFRMLDSAATVIGGEEGLGDGELTDFIMPQVHKMRVYAAPLLSEESGIEIISSQPHTVQLFNCLSHWSRQYPEHSLTMTFVMDLVQQARDIYLGQVLFDSSACLPASATEISNSISRVQHFKETLEAMPRNSQGEQVLVWASFVAASDCLLEEHRVFFEGVFRRHHARSGFGNLLRGLEYLRKIWARGPGERWTSLLPEARILVM